MAKEAPILMFGEQRVGVDPERQLMSLAALWIEIDDLGGALRDLEQRTNVQDTWLDANREHYMWSERAMHARIVRAEFERALDRMHDIARSANRITDTMDAWTKQSAQEHIHVWACFGSAAIYALAWNLVPDRDWVERVTALGQERKAMQCPF